MIYAKQFSYQIEKYRYKPWLLAYDIYGSEECDFIIMAMNGIIDPKDFELDKLKLINPQSMSNILGRIYSANETLLNSNRSDLKKDIKNDTGNTIW